MRNTIPIAILLIVLASGCRKDKFSSDSKWLVPVLETELTLGDLIPDSLVSKNSDSSLKIIYEHKIGITDLQEIVKIPDRVEKMEVTLSSLVLEDKSFKDTLTLGELYPASIFLHGTSQNLPAQDITTNEGTIIDVTEQFFTSAEFVEGYIDIEIANDLPVEAEILEFELLNSADNTVVIADKFENLLPNGKVSESYSLAGKTVKGLLELRVKRVKTKASNGDVLIEADRGLRISFGVRDLKPETATAVFPAQNLIERNDETEYDFGGARLTRVGVKTGSILMKVESTIEEAIVLNYKIPE